MCGKQYIWNLATCSYENFEWLGDVIDHSVVIKEVVIAALSELSNDTKQTVWKKMESNDKLKEIDIKKCICYYCMCYWWHN